MTKLKVATIVGTRPEIIRLSRIIAKLDQFCDHTLIHTGQSYDYELSEVFFRDLDVRRPDHFLTAGATSACGTIAKVIEESDKVLADLQPDAVLILGDTNSCLSVIPAKRRKIPTFHFEAGNRCFDMRVPEEINRRIVDHTADINLTYSQIARQHLLDEGLPSDRIIVMGSPMREVLTHYRRGIDESEALSKLGLEAGRYFVVSVHREENVDPPEKLSAFVAVLRAVSSRFGLPIVVSLHPRTRARLEAQVLSMPNGVMLLKPFGFFDYINLQVNAKAVLSDSGTITEEASILGLPALNLREAHERPEGMEEASVMMVGLNPQRVMQGLEILAAQPPGGTGALRPVADYEADNVSDKIVRVIHSYVDYVRRVVWGKC